MDARQEIKQLERKLILVIVLVTIVAILLLIIVKVVITTHYPTVDIGNLFLSLVTAGGVFSVFFYFLFRLFSKKKSNLDTTKSDAEQS